MSDRCCVIDCEREAIGTVLIGSYSKVRVCDEHVHIFGDYLGSFYFSRTGAPPKFPAERTSDV